MKVGFIILQDNIIIGANFCQVKIIRVLFQFKPSIISGNQKWKGAAPIFIRSAEFNTIENLLIKVEFKLKDIKIL